MKAIIYTTPVCGYCQMAKTLMTKRNIEYEEVTVGKDITKEELVEVLGKDVRTVPQILVDNVYVGGYTELSKFLG
jgi:glutaredoxin